MPSLAATPNPTEWERGRGRPSPPREGGEGSRVLGGDPDEPSRGGKLRPARDSPRPSTSHRPLPNRPLRSRLLKRPVSVPAEAEARKPRPPSTSFTGPCTPEVPAPCPLQREGAESESRHGDDRSGNRRSPVERARSGMPGAPADARAGTVESPGVSGAAADEARVARSTAPLLAPSPGIPGLARSRRTPRRSRPLDGQRTRPHHLHSPRRFRVRRSRLAACGHWGLWRRRSGGSAWESNPPSGPLPTRNDGFEDRGRHQPPSASTGMIPALDRSPRTPCPDASSHGSPRSPRRPGTMARPDRKQEPPS